MSARFRLVGGLVDRTHPLKFRFDGKSYTGFKGDTLASALMANGVKVIGRSFKYHRPRGIFSSGSEEPNALIELQKNENNEPNCRATDIELFDGLTAQSQNRWPSLKFDLQAINDYFAPFLTAGFYYKTFMWPRGFWEKIYEPLIRRSAGLGYLSGKTDPDSYDRGYRHCDVLIIGAGPAGLMAALSAGRSGAKVIIADEDFRMGGRLLAESYAIDNMAGSDWVDIVLEELASLSNVILMPRTTVFGAFDHKQYSALERLSEDVDVCIPRQILWQITARRTILASGAIERGIAFGNNDRPGVMLAGAMRSYVNRFAACPGQSIAVFTAHDDGWRTAIDLKNKGLEIAAIIDVRHKNTIKNIHKDLKGIRIIPEEQIIDVQGRLSVRSISLMNGERLDVDGVAVTGGWNPSLHLACQKRGRPVWCEDLAAFVANHNDLPSDMTLAGAVNGNFSTTSALTDGKMEGLNAAQSLGYASAICDLPESEDSPINITPFWWVKASKKRAWVDYQNDVTAKDIVLAMQEGFRSAEHVKRYTTLGMAPDQGKISNVIGLGIMANVANQAIKDTGTTIFRPPYTAVPIGAFAGPHTGQHFRPTRETPSHKFTREKNAKFVESGAWLRAQYIPQGKETHWRESVDREVIAIRNHVGITDVSTLGKIDVQGVDAANFLDKIYANTITTLNVGKCRYGLMLREDGIVMDDGTVAHLSSNHYVITTTTANAAQVYRHMEFCHQCLWPDLDVSLIPVTEQWAQYAIAGPKARILLKQLVDQNFDISNTAFPYLACGEITICHGIRARLFRLSFSGELAYEIAVPNRYGDSLIRKLIQTGENLNAVLYGTEAMGVMRIEKGHPAGNELNGRTTARDLGFGKMVSKKKDCIGSVLSQRVGLNQNNRPILVGFKSTNPQDQITAGSHLFNIEEALVPDNDLGYLTSVAYSPMLENYIALGYLKQGKYWKGTKLRAVDMLQNKDIEIEVVSPHFFDPEGARLHG